MRTPISQSKRSPVQPHRSQQQPSGHNPRRAMQIRGLRIVDPVGHAFFLIRDQAGIDLHESALTKDGSIAFSD
jgi:hypothetical protein